MADWTELAPMDQVSLWIGRVSRGDSNVEALLHVAYEQLAGPSEGLGWAAVPRMTAGKIEGIRAMLKASGRPAAEVGPCLRALKRVETAHGDRNALIHGHWSPSRDDASTFDRTQAGLRVVAPTVTWEIEEFERLWVKIAEAAQSAGALYKRFKSWGGETFSARWELQTEEELEGRFTLSKINDDGGGFGSFIRFTGDGVEERLAVLDDLEHAELLSRLRDAGLQNGGATSGFGAESSSPG